MKITDEAVEAAQKAWTKAYWTEATPRKDDWMRAALEAALPHLEGATPGSCTCGSYLDRDGDPQKDADAPDCPVHGEGATPAIDREALKQLASEWRKEADEAERYLNRAHASEIHDIYASIRINREHADALMALIGGAS